MIPKESELKKIGPFSMSKVATRIGADILFSSSNIKTRYRDDIFSFDVNSNTVTSLIEKHKGERVAYLFIYEKNPIRQIWGVDANGIELLSYKKATSDYKEQNSNAYGRFWCSISFAIWFIAAIFEVRQGKTI